MQDCLQDGSSCFQYADDTMVLHHPTPEDFDVDGYTPPLTLKDKTVDRVEKFKLLGTWLSENIKWKEHVNEVTSSRYKVLSGELRNGAKQIWRGVVCFSRDFIFRINI